MKKKPIYLDNNATGYPMHETTLKEIEKWTKNCFNPSTDSKYAKDAKDMIENAKNDILSHCGVSQLTHKLIFTSGATESNCFIIRACISAYSKKLKARDLIPHVLVSATEHSSIMECVQKLVESKSIEVDYIPCTIYGNINPNEVEKRIKPTTCIVCVMFAGNELPVINNVKVIADITQKNKVAFHSDCVQIFGKLAIKMNDIGIDSISASAHKFCGPKGVGISILSNELIEGYGLNGEINGTQQYGLRGGTENVPGIGGTYAAFKIAHKNREKKNADLLELRKYIIARITEIFNIGSYENYVNIVGHERKKANDFEVLFLGPRDDKFCLMNTLLISFCKNAKKPFCNIQLKEMLDAKGIIVSIGSACNTHNDHASHVLNAIGAPLVVKKGVIRISLGDMNTKAEIDKFLDDLLICVKKQVESSIPIKNK